MSIDINVLKESFYSILNLTVASFIIALIIVTVAISGAVYPNNSNILFESIILVLVISIIGLTACNYIKNIKAINAKEEEKRIRQENFKKNCEVCEEIMDEMK